MVAGQEGFVGLEGGLAGHGGGGERVSAGSGEGRRGKESWGQHGVGWALGLKEAARGDGRGLSLTTLSQRPSLFQGPLPKQDPAGLQRPRDMSLMMRGAASQHLPCPSLPGCACQTTAVVARATSHAFLQDPGLRGPQLAASLAPAASHFCAGVHAHGTAPSPQSSPGSRVALVFLFSS